MSAMKRWGSDGLRRIALIPVLLLGMAGIVGTSGEDHTSFGLGSGGDPSGSCSSFVDIIWMEVVQGNSGRALPGRAVPELGVRLKCATAAHPDEPKNITNAIIEWRVVPPGGGTVGGASTAQDTTDLSGYSGIFWTLGPTIGEQLVEARYILDDIRGQPAVIASATFSATAVAPGLCDAAAGTDHGSFTFLNATEVWTAAASPHRGQFVVLGNAATLTIEPGAVVCVESIEPAFEAPGQLIAEGTAQALIQMLGPGTTTPTAWKGISAAQSLKHVQVKNALYIGFSPAAQSPVIEDSSFVYDREPVPGICPRLVIRTDNGFTGHLLRSTIRGYGGPSCAAAHATAGLSSTVIVEARIVNSWSDGIQVGGSGSVRLTNCELSGNSGHGVFLFAPGTPPSNPTWISVNGCNLTGNLGDGINSATATIGIDAADNWWGDAAGPVGLAADGFTGIIIARTWLTAPANLGY